MWVTKFSTWNHQSTKLEKYFIEKIIQRCDYDETISKKYRTVNGFTQLKEIIKLAELSKKRIRTLRTLIIIIKESKSKFIRQNIINDIIITDYFTDLKDFISDFNEDESFKNDSLDRIDSFVHKLKKFEIQLEKNYLAFLIQDFYKIDFTDETEINRKIIYIEKLIDLLIPQLLYNGYSLSTINEVVRKWVEKKEHINIDKFFSFFNFSKNLYEIITIIGSNKENNKDLKDIIYKNGIGDVKKINKFTSDLNTNQKFSRNVEIIYQEIDTHDPVSYLRNSYDKLLKELVVNRDRKSLNIFTHFFKNSYWRKTNSINHKYFKNIVIDGDPICVLARRSTVFLSLKNNKSIDFDGNSSLDFIKNEQLKKALYYYNLALGSKSIENSISLLWTTIECILPYRNFNADIENVRDIFSKVFSFGAFTRDIQYLIKRIIVVNSVNKGCFIHLGINNLPKNNTGEDLSIWIKWLKEDCINKFKHFDTQSSLLADEYIKIIKPLIEGKLEDVLYRIKSSKESIEFQLQRIYLHRNQIVHSGDYINEYTNLWIHLEWYVGKFLYFIILKTEVENSEMNYIDLFRNLESDYEYCYSYIEKNQKKHCTNSDRILNLFFEIDWQ